MATIGKRIKKLRELAKVSQEVFAFSLGVSHGYISKLERDLAKPSSQLINLICRTFDINEEWLREGKEPLSSKPPLRSDQIQRLNKALSNIAQESLSEYFNQCTKTIKRITKYIRDTNPQEFDFIESSTELLNNKRNLETALIELLQEIGGLFKDYNSKGK